MRVFCMWACLNYWGQRAVADYFFFLRSGFLVPHKGAWNMTDVPSTKKWVLCPGPFYLMRISDDLQLTGSLKLDLLV